MNLILTTGHSNLKAADFIRMLQHHGADTVIDVRSTPASRYLPHFNQRRITELLAKVGISYVFMGDRLGGRPADNRLYTPGGQADYRLMAQAPEFQKAIEEAGKLAETASLALMCAEGNPSHCHRALLNGHALHSKGLPVAHIIPGAERTMPHEELLDGLRKKWRTEDTGLAVAKQAQHHAYRKK